MKSLQQRSKDELIDIYELFNLELPESRTNKALVEGLKQNDITNERLRTFEEKEIKEEKMIKPGMTNTGMAVIRMDRNNTWFQFKEYKFSKENKFVLMAEVDAEELLSKENGFHKASREEIEAYYIS